MKKNTQEWIIALTMGFVLLSIFTAYVVMTYNLFSKKEILFGVREEEVNLPPITQTEWESTVGLKLDRGGPLIDNSLYPKSEDDPQSLVIIGRTTGLIGDKVDGTQEPGLNKTLTDNLYKVIGDIKLNPDNIDSSYMMKYYPKDEKEKDALRRVNKMLDDTVLEDKKSDYKKDINKDNKEYKVEPYREYILETDISNTEGILNEIKIYRADYLRKARHLDNERKDYDFSTIRVHYDKDKDKNIILMAIFNISDIEEGED